MSHFTWTVAWLALPWTVLSYAMPFLLYRDVILMLGWLVFLVGSVFAGLWGAFRAQGRPQTLAIVSLFVHPLLLLGGCALVVLGSLLEEALR
ncbi:MAG: hypothetical protein WD069_04450 [Planctomycetales bacterium]